MAYKIKIEPLAILDIQDAIDWYNVKQKGLGKRFYVAVKKHFKTISLNPFFQIRYDDVRCLPIKGFPFMIHFTVSKVSNTVTIRAVFNTSRDSEKLKNF